MIYLQPKFMIQIIRLSFINYKFKINTKKYKMGKIFIEPLEHGTLSTEN